MLRSLPGWLTALVPGGLAFVPGAHAGNPAGRRAAVPRGTRLAGAIAATLLAAGCGVTAGRGAAGGGARTSAAPPGSTGPAPGVTATGRGNRTGSGTGSRSGPGSGNEPANGGGAGAASTRLGAIAFFNPADGYGAFVRAAGSRCQELVGRTTDGGARFTALAPVTSWPCAGSSPAQSLAFDDHGDGFLYGPRLFVTHNGGRTWRPGPQPGAVLSVQALGSSIWMVQADCRRASLTAAGQCPLLLLESADGGRSWAPSPTQPLGAAVPPGHAAPSGTAVSAFGQTWLVRTAVTAAYLLTTPATRSRGGPDKAGLWFTGDGGASWSRRYVPCGVPALSATLSAAPGGTLWAVCAGEGGAGFQAKSTATSSDGGRTWTVHVACPGQVLGCRGGPVDSGYLGQIDAVSARTAFLVGDRSSLEVTRDGGAHWRPVRPLLGDSGGGTGQVIFFNHADGVVVGDGAGETPVIWRTSDGGATWATVVPHTG